MSSFCFWKITLVSFVDSCNFRCKGCSCLKWQILSEKIRPLIVLYMINIFSTVILNKMLFEIFLPNLLPFDWNNIYTNKHKTKTAKQSVTFYWICYLISYSQTEKYDVKSMSIFFYSLKRESWLLAQPLYFYSVYCCQNSFYFGLIRL
jgi:hypothetical protein